MAYIAPNSQAIYQVTVYGHGPAIYPWQMTWCFAARMPGGPYDSINFPNYYWFGTYYGALVGIGGANISFDYAWCKLWPSLDGSPFSQLDLGNEQPPDIGRVAPEAAFLLRRVGAGAPSHVRGRNFVPCPTDSQYTDLPHRRHLDISAAPITTSVALLNTAVSNPASLFREVLINRKTGGAWDVTSYSIADRPGRVWQRAGWPHR